MNCVTVRDKVTDEEMPALMTSLIKFFFLHDTSGSFWAVFIALFN